MILSAKALEIAPYFTAVILGAAASSVPDTYISYKNAMKVSAAAALSGRPERRRVCGTVCLLARGARPACTRFLANACASSQQHLASSRDSCQGFSDVRS